MMMMSCGFWNVLLQKHEMLYLLRIAFSAGLGGFMYGYYLGVINNFPSYMVWDEFNNFPSNMIWDDGFNNVSHAKQCIPFESTFPWILLHGIGTTQILLWGFSWYSHRFHPQGFEPRSLVIWNCLLFIMGALCCVTFLKDIRCVFGMYFIGNGTGIIFVCSTIYLAEISPTRIRGAMVATFFLQIAAGQITYYLISLTGLLFHYSSLDDDKKYLEKYLHCMLGCIPVLFIFISNIWLPDSPNWLYALGKKEEAIEILRRTRPSIEDVAREVEAFKLSVKNIIGHDSLLPYLSKNMVAGIACFVAENLVGMDMVMYYTPRIVVHILQFDQYSSSSKYLMLETLLIKSIISAIGTLLCIGFVDRYGRRRLLLLSTFGIITCLGFLSLVLYGRSSDITSCTITGNGGIGNLGLLPLGALGLYFIFHSMGIGTIPWIINTEIYPLEPRICFGLTTTWIHWFIKIGISRFYVYLDGQYNIGSLFAILCLSSCVACYIIYVYALDTTMEEVEKLLLMEKRIASASDNEIVTNREEIPYLFSSSSSDDEGMNEGNQIDRAINHLVEPLLMA